MHPNSPAAGPTRAGLQCPKYARAVLGAPLGAHAGGEAEADAGAGCAGEW